MPDLACVQALDPALSQACVRALLVAHLARNATAAHALCTPVTALQLAAMLSTSLDALQLAVAAQHSAAAGSSSATACTPKGRRTGSAPPTAGMTGGPTARAGATLRAMQLCLALETAARACDAAAAMLAGVRRDAEVCALA